jgi:hypothetical protein
MQPKTKSKTSSKPKRVHWRTPGIYSSLGEHAEFLAKLKKAFEDASCSTILERWNICEVYTSPWTFGSCTVLGFGKLNMPHRECASTSIRLGRKQWKDNQIDVFISSLWDLAQGRVTNCRFSIATTAGEFTMLYDDFLPVASLFRKLGLINPCDDRNAGQSSQ